MTIYTDQIIPHQNHHIYNHYPNTELITILVLNFKKSIILSVDVYKTMLNDDKQFRLWSGVWSGSTLFARACLSQYLGQLQYFQFLN